VYGDFERTPYGATPYPGELIFGAEVTGEAKLKTPHQPVLQ
jgi:hypothetical protein